MVIGVYGLGRFGSFWAEQLAEHFEVSAWSRDSSRPTPPGVKRVSEDEVLGAPVVILCVAISAMEAVLRRISPRLAPGTLVMDSCSVKVYPGKLMEEILPASVEILGTHPMFGPDSGRKGIHELPLVFCPLRVTKKREETWRENFSAMGLRVLTMSPGDHDYEAAYTQGITHVIGRLLGDLSLKESSMATSGYQGLEAIVQQTCNDPWQLFLDLQKFNPYTKGMREELHKAFQRMLKKFDSIEIRRKDG